MKHLLLIVSLCLPASAALAGALVLSQPGAKAVAPEVAVGSDGSINAIWIQKRPIAESAEGEHRHAAADDLMFARSTDGGASFSTPRRITPEPGAVWGFSVSNPQIVVENGGTIHVLYPANAVDPRSERMVVVNRYMRSSDGGKTFSAPRTLNDPNLDVAHGTFLHGGVSQAHAFAALGVSPAGKVMSYWIDTRHMSSDTQAGAIYGAISEDHGETFGPDFMVWKDGVCPCCQLTLAIPSEDEVFLGLRKVYGENRDSSVACSTDGGRNFDEPVSVVNKPWEIKGCPLKPTAVAVDGDNIYTAWYSAGESPKGAYFARSKDRGESFEPAIEIHPGALIADAPVVAALRDDRVFLAWHGKVDGGRRVFWRLSMDSGATFGPVNELDVGAGRVSDPSIETMADGRVFVLAQHNDQVVLRTLNHPSHPVASAP